MCACSLTLRPGGVGSFDFGAPMDTVIALVDSELGAGQVYDHNESNDPISGCSVHITAYWAAAGLELGFTDEGEQDACTGEPTLAGWRLSTALEPRTIDVRLASGIGIGSSFDAARQAIAGLELYPNFGGIYGDVPYWAAAGTGAQRIGLSFREWDYVTAVQRGLIADGAEIVADGQLGPATSAAYQAFVAAHPGLSNQQRFELLGALPPADSGVTGISAGDRWWWEPNECGSTPFWTLEGEMCNL